MTVLGVTKSHVEKTALAWFERLLSQGFASDMGGRR